MKNAISVTPVKIFEAVVESPPVQKTTIRISGAKMAVRLKTRAIEGFGISRPPRFTAGRAEAFPSGFVRSTGFSTWITSPSSVSITYSYSWRWSFSRRRRCLRLGMGRLCRGHPALDDLGDVIAAQVIGEVAPVGGVEEDDVGGIAGSEPTDTVRAAEHVRRVDCARGECFRGTHVHLRAGERAHDRQALAEGAPRVEVGREYDDGTLVDQRARVRHRAAEEERRDREQHGGDVGPREVARAFLAGRLEVVDAHRTEVDRKRHASAFRELVRVEAQTKAGRAARLEIAPRLSSVERAALDEHICRFGDLGRLREDLRQSEVEVGVRIPELGRDG